MKVAIDIGGAASGRTRDWPDLARYAVAAEQAGADFCWSAEAWGQDAVVPLAHLSALTHTIRLGTGIMQISARVPAMAAMTALTMAAVSGDRFALGLGVSGPQVVEGLHGAPFGDPVGRLVEYLDILDLAFAGEPLAYTGSHYTLPRPGGEGKVLRLTQRAGRKIPVYLATLGPRGLELTGARADGWLGTCFIPEASAAYTEPLRRGAEQAGRPFTELDLQAGGLVSFGDDVPGLLATVKRSIAFRLGAMGSRKHNFYNRAYQRAGFAAEALRIQDLWLSGQRAEATAAVPDEMARLSSFVGSADMIRGRLRAFQEAGITTVRADPAGSTIGERIETLRQFIPLVRELAGPGR